MSVRINLRFKSSLLWIPIWLSCPLLGQISVDQITTSSTQAVLQFRSPTAGPCTFEVADMNRAITVVSIGFVSGEATVYTKTPHGLQTGAIVYLENSGGANGWHTINAVPSSVSFQFQASTGGAGGGNVGVLVDDVNPALFTGANSDARDGSLSTAQANSERTLVIGKRTAETALDGNRYSRALQSYSRHHLSLTCSSQTFDTEFNTGNIPAGDTHNEGPPVDRAHPGTYAYPTIQWNNQAQTLIDPLTGLRSKRATQAQDTPVTQQNFVAAIDAQSAWQNATGPIGNTGASATFTGPCPSGNCPLFLRADNLNITGGATYDIAGDAALDWVTVSLGQSSISGTCSGDDCKVDACLTVNGVDCAGGTIETALSSAAATHVLGTGNLMDFWQTAGSPPISRVDVSRASGTVNYSPATKQVSLASGNVFNTRWTAGSSITIAGASYTIASVQNEQLLTLAAGPNSSVSGASYSANNFGVLIWKKTASPNPVSIGYTTYSYGASSMPPWPPDGVNPCSSAVSVDGVSGYNCFLGQELFWISGDGSDVRDLGLIALSYFGAGEWSDGYGCGSSMQSQQFDPQNGDTWYCLANPYFDPTRASIVQVHYMGSHAASPPGVRLPDCANTNGQQPCIQVTLMQPNQTDSVSATAVNFNPGMKASGYVPQAFIMQGVSADGDLLIYTRLCCQDTPGWLIVYTLGDRTPTGTDPNSLHIVAAASSYQRAPMSWCSIHSLPNFGSGWAGIYSNNISYGGANFNYQMTMTSSHLNATPGVAGGLSTCPANPLGVTGQVCTTIGVTGEPVSTGNGTAPQALQIGDVIQIDAELLRVVAVSNPRSFVVQRGYMSGTYFSVPVTHAASILTMVCGTVNSLGNKMGIWNYRQDPYGTNTNWATIVNDWDAPASHGFVADQFSLNSAGEDILGETLCPLEAGGQCYLVRPGNIVTAQASPVRSIVNAAPFSGKLGIGTPNVVDSHSGPCAGNLCTDARPLDGGGSNFPTVGATLGATAAPYSLVSGQLWKLPSLLAPLNRKYLTTIAYVGRHPLADVSGPASVIGTGAPDSFKYCVPVAAGECVAGSKPGEVYVNAPYVSYPYCYYPGIAVQGDDTNSICIADLGANTANVVEFNTGAGDLVGAATRRLGPNYSKYNQFDVFWNAFISPNAMVLGSQVRWLDGARTEDLITTLPPFSSSDGVARNSFLPVLVTGAATAGASSAIVEFGYVENGTAGNFFCTSRQEACVATSSNTLDLPFTFEQSEGYQATPCANGCSIAIPGLSQRALYYRFKYLDANGQLLATGPTSVVLTP